MTGLIDMLAHQTVLAGDQTRANRVFKAFYRDGAMKRIIDAFHAHPDKEPAAIVVAKS